MLDHFGTSTSDLAMQIIVIDQPLLDGKLTSIKYVEDPFHFGGASSYKTKIMYTI